VRAYLFWAVTPPQIIDLAGSTSKNPHCGTGEFLLDLAAAFLSFRQSLSTLAP
jgi:hypothetical protein